MKYLPKKIITMIVLCFLYLATAAQNYSAKNITLKVGDKAPALKVEQWIKGAPVTTFKKGHVYIIEFSGVGCAPCRGSIPHLSALADEYNKNTSIIAVFTDKSVGSVAKFVEKMGNGITYTVAADGQAKFMQDNWTKPAGQNGIPNAFIVNQKRKIVWIGHPIEIDNRMMDAIINGKFDAQEAIAQQQRKKQLYKEPGTAQKEGDYEKALSLIDQLISESPDNPYYPITKFKILLESDEAVAYSYGQQMLEGDLKNVESSLFYMSREILYADEKNKLKNPNWDLTIALTERAAQLCKSELYVAFILKTQSEAYYKKGDYKKALEVIEKAYNIVDNLPEEEVNESTREYFSHSLKKYKEALSQQE